MATIMLLAFIAVVVIVAHGTESSRVYNCSDVAPDSYYTCLEHKGFGNCNDLLTVTPTAELPEAFCQTTCGRCPTMPTLTMTTQSQSRSFFKAPSTSINSSSLSTDSIARSRSLLASCTCTDSQPDKTYTCAQQKAFGKCSADFVAGKEHCQTTCGHCTCNPSCKCDDVRPPGSYTCAQQRAFGKCSLDFMKKGSRYPPVAPNGYCRLTCGACNCNTAQTTNPTPSRTQKPTPATPRSPTPARPSPSPATLASTSPTPNPGASSSPNRAATRSPSQAATRGPPAPLSAAYLANCQCIDAPPPDTSSCADVLAAGHCDVYETVTGSKAHPEGFCQKTCNRCNNYCVPKSAGAAPATPATSSSTPSSPGCSDNPPDNKYTCAQQKSFGQCGQSFMTKGNYCLRTCGQCFKG